MHSLIDLVCGISWSIVYIVAIAIGLKKSVCCIPSYALCMNFSWELCAVVNRSLNGTSFSTGYVSQLFWLILDIGVLLTWVRYNHALQFKAKVFRLLFLLFSVYAVAVFLDEWLVSVFTINLLMSIEFFVALRAETIYPSILVALFKMIGTFAATILNGLVISDRFVLWIGGCCLILDIYYFVCLLQKEVTYEKK